MTPPPSPGLVRGLGLGSAFCVVAGSVIGSGVFLVATDIAKSVPSPLQALSVWVLAGALSLIGGLVFSELGAMFPAAGGQYVFLRESFGDLMAFLFGWTVFAVIQTGTIAAVAMACAKFSTAIFPIPEARLNLAAAAVIVGLTGVNMLDIRKGASFLDAITSLKILALIVIAAAGFLLPARAPSFGAQAAAFQAPAFGVALIAAFWAYDGWSNLAYVAGEMKEPQRNIPVAMASGVAVVGLLYIGANLAYFRMMPVADILTSSFVGSDAARLMAGESGVKALGVAVTLSALGCVNAMILAGARVIYAMATAGTLPASLAYVHPVQRVPTVALLVQMVWSILLVWSGSYDQLFTYVMCAQLAFYALTAAAVFVLRRSRPELDRPYRVPLYPWLPAVYVLFMGAIVVNTFIEKPVEALWGLGIVLLGLPLYYWVRRPRTAAGAAAATAAFVALLATGRAWAEEPLLDAAPPPAVGKVRAAAAPAGVLLIGDSHSAVARGFGTSLLDGLSRSLGLAEDDTAHYASCGTHAGQWAGAKPFSSPCGQPLTLTKNFGAPRDARPATIFPLKDLLEGTLVHAPKAILLALGSNPDSYGSLAAERAAAKKSAALARVASAAARCVWIGPPDAPYFRRDGKDALEDRYTALREALGSCAADGGPCCELVDSRSAWKADAKCFRGDGLHPTTACAVVWGQAAAGAVEEKLRGVLP
ncbi:MAG: amino acid permease [Elusimicrobia bacterium]|nr:amino acid permease [Elusimicrobiota bacterium]